MRTRGEVFVNSAPPASDSGPTRQWENRFEITNGAELTLDYRLLAITGLPSNEHYEKNLNQLLKQVRYEMKEPVALVKRDGTHHLAIPVHGSLPALEQPLLPHLVQLHPSNDVQPLSLARLDDTTRPIAVAFLQYVFRRPLWGDQRLWLDGARSYEKSPLSADERQVSIDVYRGFTWGIETDGDGRLFLGVDVRSRYIDRLWLPERLARQGKSPRDVFMRHCLYLFGNQWYIVQLMQPTGASVAEQKFFVDGAQDAANVLAYTHEKCGGMKAPPWVRDLDPASAAILYRYPGNYKERHGALGLCKLTYRTNDPEVAYLHRRSILDPSRRFALITATVLRHFQNVYLGDQPVRVSIRPHEIQRRVFSVPAQRFGHDRVVGVRPVAVGPSPQAPTKPVTDLVQLRDLGRRRLDLLQDPAAGPLDTTPFDTQYILLPYSLPRPVVENFRDRFLEAMRKVSGQATYDMRLVMYQDSAANSLFRQLQAIRSALDSNNARRGYALLVLPPNANPKLHHHIKAAMWPEVQIQCARADRINSYYAKVGDGRWYNVIPDRAGKFASYLRNCALGMLVVNRKWPWALAAPLHYDLYVGIDVLNHIAGVTFVHAGAEKIFFYDHKSTQPERLTTQQMRDILVSHLRIDLPTLGVAPRSLIIHRDGRTFESERKGLRRAVRDLQIDGLLPLDITVGIVDIRKTTAVASRIVEGKSLDTLENPTLGSYAVRGEHEGVVCNTGWPFYLPGTANPLTVVIAEGDLRIDWVLEDVFALSQGVFTAPDRCARLPLTIKLADDLLEPIAAAKEDDEALYDEDEDDDSEEGVEQPASPVRNGQIDAA